METPEKTAAREPQIIIEDNPRRPRLAQRQALRNVLVLPRRCLVHVVRDMAEILPSIVFEHEIDVMSECFGEGRIDVQKDPLEYGILIADQDVLDETRVKSLKAAKLRLKVTTLFYYNLYPVRPDDDGVLEYAPVYVGDEMERLRSAYGKHPAEDKFCVDVAYPNERDFIEACGGIYKPKKVPKVTLAA